jgi:hypothetical protein
MISNSQSYQDIFALKTCTNKTYIEIGGNDPIKGNNSYLLEKNDFQGFSIEFDQKWQKRWHKSDRQNKIYWDDALTFDYTTAANENNLSKQIGYLSCDIEPPTNTFAALKKIIEQGFEFECITFEHDEYNFPNTNFNHLATEFLLANGYKIAVYNVYFNISSQHFETWYVRNNIEFKELDYSNWMYRICN